MTSHHLMWSLVRATSTAVPRAVPSRDRRENRRATRRGRAARSTPAAIRRPPPGRTTSAVASCGTVAATLGAATRSAVGRERHHRELLPAPVGGHHPDGDARVGGSGDEGTDGGFGDGPEEMRERRRPARVERPPGREGGGCGSVRVRVHAHRGRLACRPAAAARGRSRGQERQRPREPERRSMNGEGARLAAAPTRARARSGGTRFSRSLNSGGCRFTRPRPRLPGITWWSISW